MKAGLSKSDERTWLRRVTGSGSGDTGAEPETWAAVWRALDGAPSPSPVPPDLGRSVLERLRRDVSVPALTPVARAGAALCFVVGCWIGFGPLSVSWQDSVSSSMPAVESFVPFDGLAVSEPTLAEAYWAAVQDSVTANSEAGAAGAGGA